MKTIYYSDPLHDDFANNGILSKPLPEDYKYIRNNPVRRSFDFLFYHCIAVPLVYVYQKVRFREKIVNRRALLEMPLHRTLSHFRAKRILLQVRTRLRFPVYDS